MSEREWPVNRARAWLLRKAAEMVEVDTPSDVAYEMMCDALEPGAQTIASAGGFRQIIDWVNAWHGPRDLISIDRAVAEVYGEACGCGNRDCHGPADNEHHQCGGPREACAVPGCAECGAKAPTTPRPAEEVARAMVQDPGDAEGRRLIIVDGGGDPEAVEFVCLEEQSEPRWAKVQGDVAVAIITRLIERSRAEGAAAEAKRITDRARGWVELLMPSDTEEGDRCRSIAEEAMSEAKRVGYEEGVAAARARVEELEAASCGTCGGEVFDGAACVCCREARAERDRLRARAKAGGQQG